MDSVLLTNHCPSPFSNQEYVKCELLLFYVTATGTPVLIVKMSNGLNPSKSDGKVERVWVAVSSGERTDDLMDTTPSESYFGDDKSIAAVRLAIAWGEI